MFQQTILFTLWTFQTTTLQGTNELKDQSVLSQYSFVDVLNVSILAQYCIKIKDRCTRVENLIFKSSNLKGTCRKLYFGGKTRWLVPGSNVRNFWPWSCEVKYQKSSVVVHWHVIIARASLVAANRKTIVQKSTGVRTQKEIQWLYFRTVYQCPRLVM